MKDDLEPGELLVGALLVGGALYVGAKLVKSRKSKEKINQGREQARAIKFCGQS
jgi:hypothetical protein